MQSDGGFNELLLHGNSILCEGGVHGQADNQGLVGRRCMTPSCIHEPTVLALHAHAWHDRIDGERVKGY